MLDLSCDAEELDFLLCYLADDSESHLLLGMFVVKSPASAPKGKNYPILALDDESPLISMASHRLLYRYGCGVTVRREGLSDGFALD